MKSSFYALASILALTAVPAAASSVVDGKCVSVTASAGCLFETNINSANNGSPNSYVSAQNAYNTYNDTHSSAAPDITLSAIVASNDGNFSSFGSITGAGTSSGSWTLTGYLVDFVAVKASDNFVLYKLATPASSGNWNTFNIPYNQNPPALSHLVFFGTRGVQNGVPEPATWAMMLIGFGVAGYALGRRKVRVTYA